ncbi:MAG: amylo-alpha-1,6-glucosidase [Acidimicrobiales bacterium]
MTAPFELRARADRRFIYSGYSMLVTDAHGAVTGEGTEGFYIENTRLLCRQELTADGVPLVPFAASATSRHGFLAYAEVAGGPQVPDASVYLEIARTVSDEGMRTRIRIENYAFDDQARGGAASFLLGINLAADFADIEEADSGKRTQTAEVEARWDESAQELVFAYLHPKLRHCVAVRLERSPAPASWTGTALIVALVLAPGHPVELELCAVAHLDPVQPDRRARLLTERVASISAVTHALLDEAPVLTTTNSTVARAWQTAIEDLASLPLGVRTGPATPVAGLPIFQQLFGRDSLTIAGQAALAMPTMLRDTLLTNAAWQGEHVDDWLDEEPGKMLHQARRGPLSLLGEDPFVRYYGDYTAPADFLIMLGVHLLWSGDRSVVDGLLPAARRVLEWMHDYGDCDGDGFLEYQSKSSKGVKQQGWKDSRDAIVDDEGRVIEPPIATSVVQAYEFFGLRLAAVAFAAAGHRLEAATMLRGASRLKRRFHAAFWMPDRQFYAMALGPDGALVRSISSNGGHMLAAGIVPKDLGPVVARRLLEPDLFSGWGVRTLSSAHTAYNPFSYHRGSVWPVENASFALGLARYGCVDELHRLASAIFDSTELFAGNRLPEVLGGITRDDEHAHPGVYPTSNQPQGWSASAIVALVQALLGLQAVAPLGLLLIDPHLPPWLPDVRLEGLRVGSARLDIEFRRERQGQTSHKVTASHGRVRVLRQPPPEAHGITVGRRARVGLRSLIRRRGA